MKQKYNELQKKHDFNVEEVSNMMAGKQASDKEIKNLVDKMLESAGALVAQKKHDFERK